MLEALCGSRFQVGDGLCTVFATEYVLRRSEDESIAISIKPDIIRPDHEKSTLNAWKPTTNDLEEFESIMEQAKTAMGIGKGKNFSHDRLRIEVSGPTHPHLSLIDVSGPLKS